MSESNKKWATALTPAQVEVLRNMDFGPLGLFGWRGRRRLRIDIHDDRSCPDKRQGWWTLELLRGEGQDEALSHLSHIAEATGTDFHDWGELFHTHGPNFHSVSCMFEALS